MSVAEKTNDEGDFDWQDSLDNWTDADVNWVQRRMIVRVASETPDVVAEADLPNSGGVGANEGSVANTEEGRVFYAKDTNRLIISIDGTNFARVASSQYVELKDTSATNIELKAKDRSSGTGIVFNSTTGEIKIGSTAVQIDPGTDVRVTVPLYYGVSDETVKNAWTIISPGVLPAAADTPLGTIAVVTL